MGNRKKATEELLKYIDKLIPNSGNKEIYEKRLSKMTDSQFEAYMRKLESGEEILSIVAPNMSKSKLNAARSAKIAKELGVDVFQKLILTDPKTGITYITKYKYPVIDLPVRRQAQVLSKKISVPKENKRVDELTGQTAEGRVGGISFPEIQVLAAQGLDKTIEELVKFRGGDELGFRDMNNQILKTGSVNLDTIPNTSRAKSTDTLSIFLKAMHFDNTL